MLLKLDSSTQRVGLAAIGAMLGLMPLAILPAYLGVLVSHGGLTPSDAGVLCSLNLLGNALGVMWISWRPSQKILPILFVGFALEVIADVGASFMGPSSLFGSESSSGLYFLRIAAGIGGGLFTGIGFQIIAASNKTEQGFGFLIFLQFLLGAIVLECLPGFLGDHGVTAIYATFLISALISLAAFLCLPPSANDSSFESAKAGVAEGKPQHPAVLNYWHAAIALLAIAAFEISASGVWAYAEQIGLTWGIPGADISRALAWGALAGIPGAALVMFQGDKFGRVLPILLAVLIAFVSLLALTGLSGTGLIFLSSMVVFNFAWSYAVPFMQAEQASLDQNGQLATFGMAAVLLAIAFGPYLFSLFIAGDGYSLAVFTCLALLIVCAVLSLALSLVRRA